MDLGVPGGSSWLLIKVLVSLGWVFLCQDGDGGNGGGEVCEWHPDCVQPCRVSLGHVLVSLRSCPRVQVPVS